ncbi:MAG: DUF2125 domain-containing protein [Beijerinckiaceae bacterium]|nr:DUF2125 domain-containing protein [Beijerinckiaceae bacterium]
MAEHIVPPGESKRFRAGLYLPFIGMATLCLIWTGIWFFSASRAESIAEAFIAREGERGREWVCPNRSIGGYPFRIVISCNEPRLVTVEPDGLRREGRLGSLSLHARILSPGHFIAILGAPFVAREGEAGMMEIGWTSARASLRAGAESITEASVEIVGPTLAAGAPQRLDTRALAKGIDLHLRRSPGNVAGTDLVALVQDLTFAPLDHLAGTKDPIRMEFQATAPGLVPDPRARFQDVLEAWRLGGQKARVIVLKASKGPAVIDLAGEIGLDEARRPEGNLQGRARGLDGLLGSLTRRGGVDMGGLLGRLSGGQGMPIALSLERGRMRFGPFPIAELAPLY